MVVDYLSFQPNRAGDQVSTKKGSGPKSIPDAVIAESILNRLVAGAEIIALEGDNMRLTT